MPKSKLILKSNNDVYAFLKQIINDIVSKREFRKLSKLAFERFLTLKNDARYNFEDLLKEIKNVCL